MISLSKASNVHEIEGFQTPSKKRSKKGEKDKKSKKRKVRVETLENIDVNNVGKEDAMKETTESPIYVPSLSSPEPDTPESCVDTPIQSHANVDLVTFNHHCLALVLSQHE